MPSGIVLASDEHAVGVGQVGNRRALCQELGVGEDLEVYPGVGTVATQDLCMDVWKVSM